MAVSKTITDSPVRYALSTHTICYLPQYHEIVPLTHFMPQQLPSKDFAATCRNALQGKKNPIFKIFLQGQKKILLDSSHFLTLGGSAIPNAKLLSIAWWYQRYRRLKKQAFSTAWWRWPLAQSFPVTTMTTCKGTAPCCSCEFLSYSFRIVWRLFRKKTVPFFSRIS